MFDGYISRENEVGLNNTSLNDGTDDSGKLEGEQGKGDENRQREPNKAYWNDMMHESGRESDQMGRGEKSLTKRRNRKVKSCFTVYKYARLCPTMRTLKRSKGRSNGKKATTKDIPMFLPGSRSHIAGGSVEDSCIENRNKEIRKKSKKRGAKEMWEFAKAVGLVTNGAEEEIFHKIEEMEDRDSRKGAELRKKKQDKNRGTPIIQ